MDRPIIGEGGEMDNAEFVEILAVNQAPGDEALAQRLEAGLNRLAGLDFMLLDLVRKMLQGERLTSNTDNPASVRRSSSLAVAASGDSGEDEPDELVPAPIVCREFNISAMTLWRWDHDRELAALGLPPPVIIRKRKFRVRRQFETFKQRMLRRQSIIAPRPRRRARWGRHQEMTANKWAELFEQIVIGKKPAIIVKMPKRK